MKFIDIILFAVIALFIILRLRSVLGRRDGHEGGGHVDPFRSQGPMDGGFDGRNDNVIPLQDQSADRFDDPFEEDEEEEDGDPLSKGIRDIRRADPDFDAEEFLVGARVAFEMVIGAFATGDRDMLKSLLSPDVYDNFHQAIRTREQENQTLEKTLINIDSADMVEAYLEGVAAHVTVKFVTEQIDALRDAQGDLLEGDPDKILSVTDFWTFVRDTTSSDPNWSLAATRSLD